MIKACGCPLSLELIERKYVGCAGMVVVQWVGCWSLKPVDPYVRFMEAALDFYHFQETKKKYKKKHNYDKIDTVE